MRGSDGNEIDDIAVAWVAREDRTALDTEQVAARDAWLRADTRHFGAYARAHAVLARTGRARALSAGSGVVNTRMQRVRSSMRWVRRVAGLAAVLGVVAVGVWHHDGEIRHLATSKGQILRVPLPDGSAITLDSDSQVRVRFSDRQRSLTLIRGEALFDVAKDPQRPFVVRAEDTAVTAVGTSFSVSLNERRNGNVEVLVREGVVDVADTHGAVAPARLAANQRALANRGQGIRIEAVDKDDLVQQLAWREGMLSFNGDTLSAAAAQFLRYSNIRIVIDDPVVGSHRIVGLYSASDPLGFARSVALSLGLVVEQQGKEVRLRAPESASRSVRSLQ